MQVIILQEYIVQLYQYSSFFYGQIFLIGHYHDNFSFGYILRKTSLVLIQKQHPRKFLVERENPFEMKVNYIQKYV